MNEWMDKWVWKNLHYSRTEQSQQFSSCYCQIIPIFIPVLLFSLAFQGWRLSTLGCQCPSVSFTWVLSWEISLFYLLSEQIPTCMNLCTSSSVCSLWLTWLSPLLLCPKSSAFFGSMTGRSTLKHALYKYFSFTHYAAWPQGLSWPWPLTGMWQSAILWNILPSWHTESSRTWDWLLSSVGLCSSALNPSCFGGFLTVERISSLTLTVSLWHWSSLLVQRPESTEHTA